MMKLDEPSYSFEQTLEECKLGVTGNEPLLGRFEFSREGLLAQGGLYAAAAQAGDLYRIEPIQTGSGSDGPVVGALSKSDLVKFYEQYFVAERKPARRVYDALLNSAKEKCPFCGGVGTPRNLDHFLPKTHFPQFSVLPLNLVPACRDCNMDGKGHGFARLAEDQRIQPYLDQDKFFLEQWIFARYYDGTGGNPGEFEYFVEAPGGWLILDKQRARNQFEAFDLAKRYATKAAEALGTVIRQMEKLRDKGLDNDAIQTALLQPGVDEAPFVNHWQKGMYEALIAHLANVEVGEKV